MLPSLYRTASEVDGTVASELDELVVTVLPVGRNAGINGNLHFQCDAISRTKRVPREERVSFRKQHLRPEGLALQP
jgi:hypothetical protein